MKPMGGRTWKYWPASGPVFFFDKVCKESQSFKNLMDGVATLLLVIYGLQKQLTKFCFLLYV